MENNNLAFKLYVPKKEVKAAMVIVHGMQEHQLRYTEFAQDLNEKGIAVFTFDLPGHGRSVAPGELLGYFGKHGWDNLVESARAAVAEMRRKYPDVPLWIFGHSMGSMIVRCLLQEHDQEVDGVILCGVIGERKESVIAQAMLKPMCYGNGGKGHSKMLDAMMAGGYSKAVKDRKTDLDWLSYNEDNVQAYIDDPLCGNPFTIQGYADLVDGMLRMFDASRYEVSYPELPMLLIAGEEDPCIGGKAGFEHTVAFLKNLGYQNIDTKLFLQMRHEILNEKQKDLVYETVEDFVVSHYTK